MAVGNWLLIIKAVRGLYLFLIIPFFIPILVIRLIQGFLLLIDQLLDLILDRFHFHQSKMRITDQIGFAGLSLFLDNDLIPFLIDYRILRN